MMKIFVMILAMLISFKSFAADKKRNGGSVLLCDSKYQTLDLYEAGQYFKGRTEFPQGSDYKTIVKILIGKVRRIEPDRAHKYESYLEDFLKSAEFVPQAQITPISDVGEGVVLPKNCNLKQVVSQIRHPVENTIRYLIDKDVWTKLSAADQAALTMHEIIYRDFFENDPSLSVSTGVRWFNGYLHSTLANTGSIKNYVSALQTAGAPSFYYKGVLLRTQGIEFSGEEELKTAILAGSLELNSGTTSYRVECLPQTVTDAVHIEFSVTGESAILRSQCPMKFPLILPGLTTSSSFISEELTFDLHSKRPLSATVSSKNYAPLELFSFAYRIPGASILSQLNGAAIYFSPNGIIQQLEMIIGRTDAAFTTYVTVDSAPYPLKTYTKLDFAFDDLGRLKSAVTSELN